MGKKSLLDLTYFNDLSDKHINELQMTNFIVCDIGKKNLLFMMDRNRTIFKYTSKQYLNESKHWEILSNMNKFNTEIKNCNIYLYNTDVIYHNYINECYKFYIEYYWLLHFEKQKTQAKILESIKNTYGDNLIIMVGDMDSSLVSGNKNYKNYDWLIDLLSNRFTVYKMNEYRTSLINAKTFEINKKAVINKNNKLITLNSVFTFTHKDGQPGYINRDKNAVINMLYIVEYWLELYNYFKKYKNISDCNLIKNDARLNNFLLENNNPDTDNINKFMQICGRPVPF